MKIRRRLLWVLTISTAGLAAAGYDASVNREERATPGGEGAKTAPAPLPVAERSSRPRSLLELERLQTARAQPPAAELFAVKSWDAPPPPPPAPPPPQAAPAPVKPVAPPLPFVFMGRMTEEDRVSVFLVKDERAYIAAVGDVIEGTYRVEKIEPRQVTLLYLPLDMAQTLAVKDPHE
jgi:hypothetical protein